uniref:Uncharacterized protein n=1 Tax=Leptobrachium leishanense TaxID=445787 RepID=A0A8C5Q945_9ANUR
MAPPKAQRTLEPQKSAKKDRVREAQDGGSPSSVSSFTMEAAVVGPPCMSDTSPPSESRLHAMLQELRSTIQTDIKEALQELRRDVQDLGERTDSLESKADDLCLAHNDLVDRHIALQAAHDTMASKLADMEDRSRRNNVRIRGIPEAVAPADLQPYIMELFQILVPAYLPQDFLMDRAHRLPRAKNLPPSASRDVLVRVHFFHVKEALMRASRKSMPLPSPYAEVSFYADLSTATMTKRREFSSFTKILRDHNMAYRWGFPTKILLWREGALHVIPDPLAGMRLLTEWKVVSEFTPPRVESSSPLKVSPEWHRIRPK